MVSMLMDADQVRKLRVGLEVIPDPKAAFLAQLAAEWEAQREALLDILEGRTLRTDKEKAREALSALAVSSSAPTTRKRRRSDGRSD
jgi:hypothetical protein